MSRRWLDIDAGKSAGRRTIFVRHGYAEEPAQGYDHEITQLSQPLEWIS